MKKAILAVVDTGFLKDDESLLTECKELCLAAGYQIEITLIQKSRSLDPQTALRKGKLLELQTLARSDDYEALVFYNRLSFAQVRGLTEFVELEVIDRSHLILDIFDLRARSKEAQLQIEMARLRYAVVGRTTEQGAEDQIGGGSLHNKGAGETRSALQARQNRHRIAQLKAELAEIGRRNSEKKNRRNRSGLKKVALVGYTNAGKSTILNGFVKSESRMVLAEDRLFATLDATARRIQVGKYEFYLFDTVGFVSDLPHELIEAFRSTLSCVQEADCLVHVIDASDPHWLMHKEVTEETLKRIGAEDIPRIVVFNKVDLLPQAGEFDGISAFSAEGIAKLGKMIVAAIYPPEAEKKCIVPYSSLGVAANYRSMLEFETLEENGEGILYRVSGEEKTLSAFIHQAGGQYVEG